MEEKTTRAERADRVRRSVPRKAWEEAVRHATAHLVPINPQGVADVASTYLGAPPPKAALELAATALLSFRVHQSQAARMFLSRVRLRHAIVCALLLFGEAERAEAYTIADVALGLTDVEEEEADHGNA